MYHLHLRRQHVTQVVTTLMTQHDRLGLGLAGRNYTRSGTVLLGRALSTVPASAPRPESPEDQLCLRLAHTTAALHDESWLTAPAPGEGPPGRVHVYLTLGVEALSGQWRGTVVEAGGRTQPVHTLRLVGADMATLACGTRRLHSVPVTHNGQGERWSRTIGALGDLSLWQHLSRLRLGIVGVSRTGSLVASSLAQLGVQHLTLIDPDLVEAHHLDSMDGVSDHALGRPKVMAVAAHLRQLQPTLTVTALPHRVTEQPSLVHLKDVDGLFCCVDNDAARLIATTLATLYLKPLIDVGTGIFLAPSPPASRHPSGPTAPRLRQMGCDVRCVLPGEACLLCAGGLVHEAEARHTLATWSPVRATPTTLPWQQQRAGSLRPVNQLAAHLGVQMWLDLVAGRLENSRWAQAEFDDTGQLQVRYPLLAATEAEKACVLCSKAGLGDAGLGWLAL